MRLNYYQTNKPLVLETLRAFISSGAFALGHSRQLFRLEFSPRRLSTPNNNHNRRWPVLAQAWGSLAAPGA